ncbi:MAG TPA: DNA methyltransferase, partial [Bacteroidales bacterium]|nr:DNA methyltransferase [Bacteroidales bacterium]
MKKNIELQEVAVELSPCYMQPFLSLYHCDCMELLRQTPDNYYSLALIDPPYGLGMGTVSIPSEKNTNSQQKFYKDLKSKRWDDNTPNKKYFDELKRVSKNQIVWGGNYMAEHLGNTKCIIIWDKMTYIPTMSQFEFAFCSFNKHPKMVKINSTDIDRIHPTQKPVKLYEWILKNYAKEGERILDTHFGSLSIGIACEKLGFELTAIELDKD